MRGWDCSSEGGAPAGANSEGWAPPWARRAPGGTSALTATYVKLARRRGARSTGPRSRYKVPRTRVHYEYCWDPVSTGGVLARTSPRNTVHARLTWPARTSRSTTTSRDTRTTKAQRRSSTAQVTMPTYVAVQCFACQAFQVIQEPKKAANKAGARKWACRLCGNHGRRGGPDAIDGPKQQSITK